MTSPAEPLRLRISSVAPADSVHFGDFRCGSGGDDQDFADFLRDDALDFQALHVVSTYLSFRAERLVGYVTTLKDKGSVQRCCALHLECAEQGFDLNRDVAYKDNLE